MAGPVRTSSDGCGESTAHPHYFSAVPTIASISTPAGGHQGTLPTPSDTCNEGELRPLATESPAPYLSSTFPTPPSTYALPIPSSKAQQAEGLAEMRAPHPQIVDQLYSTNCLPSVAWQPPAAGYQFPFYPGLPLAYGPRPFPVFMPCNPYLAPASDGSNPLLGVQWGFPSLQTGLFGTRLASGAPERRRLESASSLSARQAAVRGGHLGVTEGGRRRKTVSDPDKGICRNARPENVAFAVLPELSRNFGAQGGSAVPAVIIVRIRVSGRLLTNRDLAELTTVGTPPVASDVINEEEEEGLEKKRLNPVESATVLNLSQRHVRLTGRDEIYREWGKVARDLLLLHGVSMSESKLANKYRNELIRLQQWFPRLLGPEANTTTDSAEATPT